MARAPGARAGGGGAPPVCAGNAAIPDGDRDGTPRNDPYRATFTHDATPPETALTLVVERPARQDPCEPTRRGEGGRVSSRMCSTRLALGSASVKAERRARGARGPNTPPCAIAHSGGG